MNKLFLTDNFLENYFKFSDGVNATHVEFKFLYTQKFSELTKDIYIKLLNDFLESFEWVELVFNFGFVEHKYESIKNFYNDLDRLESIKSYYDDYPYFSFHIGLKYNNINTQTSGIVCGHSNVDISVFPFENYLKAQIEIEIKPDFFYKRLIFDNNSEFLSEYVLHNRSVFNTSIYKLKEKGYIISYLPINYVARAYRNGARWDETGFLEFGKYSKYSDNNLINLYKMMIKNNEDLSEIVLELQVRNLPR